MKVEQEKTPFKPINIRLENQHEAEAFFSLIDKVEDGRCNEGSSVIELSEDEIRLVIELSNMNSDGDFII